MKPIPPDLTGRAKRDPEFHRQLLTDPVAAAASVGVSLDADQVEYLKNPPDAAIDRAADAAGGDDQPLG